MFFRKFIQGVCAIWKIYFDVKLSTFWHCWFGQELRTRYYYETVDLLFIKTLKMHTLWRRYSRNSPRWKSKNGGVNVMLLKNSDELEDVSRSIIQRKN